MSANTASELARTLGLMKTHAVCVEPGDPISSAVDVMDIYQISSVPVVTSAGQLCGILSEQDVLDELRVRAEVVGAMAGAATLSTSRVDAIMSVPVSIEESTPLVEAAHLLLSSGFRRLPVVNSGNQVIGVLNRIDILQALLDGSVEL